MDIAVRIVVLTVCGACGVNARYWLGVGVARWIGVRFPWATVAINVSGSFAIGLAAVLLAERWPHPLVRIGVLTGFLGGYTTFSAYMLESVTLWERGDRPLAALNLVGSLIAGLLAVLLGMALGRSLIEPHPSRAARAALEERLEAVSETLAGQESTEPPSA